MDALHSLTVLRSLCIPLNAAVNARVAELGLSRWRHLDLIFGSVGVAGVIALEQLTALTYLDLMGNKVGGRADRSLRHRTRL